MKKELEIYEEDEEEDMGYDDFKPVKFEFRGDKYSVFSMGTAFAKYTSLLMGIGATLEDNPSPLKIGLGCLAYIVASIADKWVSAMPTFFAGREIENRFNELERKLSNQGETQ